MKILFVAVFTPNSTNVSQSRGLKDNGYEVYEYDYRAALRRHNNMYNRDNELIEIIHEFQPDLTIFSKCNHMNHRVVDESNSVGKTAIWYMDATHNFDVELIEKVKRCSMAIYGLPGVVKYSLEYNKNSFFLDQCPDDQMNFMLDDIKYKYDTTFIGVMGDGPIHADRVKYFKNVGFTHINGVYGLEHNKIVNSSKINLNFSPTDGTGASVRIYKILAAGGFLLTSPWVEEYMNESFTINKDFVIFNNESELRDKIKYYLNNEEERNTIRLHGNKTVQQYLPVSWAKKIIDKTKEL